jgi:subtilisin family serine protease
MKRLIAVLTVSVLSLACDQFPSPQPPSESYDCISPEAKGFLRVTEPIEGQYIIHLKKPAGRTTTAVTIQKILKDFGIDFKVTDPFKAIDAFFAKIDEDIAKAMAFDPRVLYVEQNGIKRINVAASWGQSRVSNRERILNGDLVTDGDGTGVTIAVLDTGEPTDLTEFGSRYLGCIFSVDGDNCKDGHGHSSHVAGTTSGRTYGIARGAFLIALKTLHDNGSATDAECTSAMDAAIRYKKEHNIALVANASWGGGVSQTVDEMACKMWDAGIPFAVAAGNDYGDACEGSPSHVEQLFTIGATTDQDNRADFSNTGSCIDMWAPGVDIISIGGRMTGTSMAAPHAAGALALILAKHPTWSPDQVFEGLRNSATKDVLGGVSGSPNLLLYVRSFGGSE